MTMDAAISMVNPASPVIALSQCRDSEYGRPFFGGCECDLAFTRATLRPCEHTV